MNTRRASIPLIAMLLLTAAACNSEGVAFEHRSLVHDGIDREYYVYRPGNSDAKQLPLVVALHGYTGTAVGFEDYHGMRAHADRNGYMVVYPQGTGFEVEATPAFPGKITSWNDLAANLPSPPDRPHCTAGSARYPCPPECGSCAACMWTSCNDDVGFIEAMLDQVIDEYPVDASRVYLLGVSNGGMMALRLGCNMSSRFAAIAPIIGQLAPGYACGPDVDVPMLHLAGGKDEVVRADGKAGASDGFIYSSVAETIAVWSEALGCTVGPETWVSETAAAAGLECEAYSACRTAEHEVVSCIAPDGGHQWPAQNASQDRGMQLVWEFFRRYETQPDNSLK